MIATLYEKKGRSTITEHLKNIFSDGELDENSTCIGNSLRNWLWILCPLRVKDYFRLV
jgi:hypothetical protein